MRNPRPPRRETGQGLEGGGGGGQVWWSAAASIPSGARPRPAAYGDLAGQRTAAAATQPLGRRLPVPGLPEGVPGDGCSAAPARSHASGRTRLPWCGGAPARAAAGSGCRMVRVAAADPRVATALQATDAPISRAGNRHPALRRTLLHRQDKGGLAHDPPRYRPQRLLRDGARMPQATELEIIRPSREGGVIRDLR